MTKPLRLVLGPGRSGTTWLAKTLSQCDEPTRSILEPLHPWRPKVQLSDGEDHTAASYRPSVDADHPVVLVYRHLCQPTVRPIDCCPEGWIVRDDPDFSVCVIKEVHALLLTEALARRLNCRTVVLTRSPVAVLDSVFTLEGLNSIVFDCQFAKVREDAFLEAYFPTQATAIRDAFNRAERARTDRERTIGMTGLTVALINGMLERIAGRLSTVLHIRYEELCHDPAGVFESAFEHLGLHAGERAHAFMQQSQNTQDERYNPYSTNRVTARMTAQKYKFLQETEVAGTLATLEDCGLADPPTH